MLNYPLTDFSLKELTVLSVLIQTEIQEKTSRANVIEQYFGEIGNTKEELLRNARYGLPELEEIRVRVLTAIDIVKQRETTNTLTNENYESH